MSVLVMCHTRELAFQISKEYERFSKYMPNVKVRGERNLGQEAVGRQRHWEGGCLSSGIPVLSVVWSHERLQLVPHPSVAALPGSIL